eukprot:3472587-Prymnesium_polylepis.1
MNRVKTCKHAASRHATSVPAGAAPAPAMLQRRALTAALTLTALCDAELKIGPEDWSETVADTADFCVCSCCTFKKPFTTCKPGACP